MYKNFLKARNITPKHSLGQNFLVDRNIVNKIIDAAQLSKEDTVIEVGAGLGALTVPLAERCHKVIAYEIDRRLTPLLIEAVSEFDNVEIREEDILNFQFSMTNFQFTNYKLIGNLPYYITSRILRSFLESENKPEVIVITIQKEVAERIVAKPPEMSLLAVSVQFYGQPQIVDRVPRHCFWPQPEVDSAVLKIEKIQNPQGIWNLVNEKRFFELVKAGFSHRRKLLINNLRGNYSQEVDRETWKKIFQEVGLNVKARAQELSVEEWVRLTKNLKAKS
jgi:16S rRNA (adenine1518-N6/adenine1519-N6)-dimethyltransferase